MILDEWAKRWQIPSAALEELRTSLRIDGVQHSPEDGRSEAAIQAATTLAASKLGARVFRNNVGAGKLENGSFLRWGLCNETKARNDAVKSSDLIGWYSRVVTPDMVGSLVAQFVSFEVKEGRWRYSGDAHEQAQLAWINAVVAAGGIAAFVNDPQQLNSLLTATVNK